MKPPRLTTERTNLAFTNGEKASSSTTGRYIVVPEKGTTTEQFVNSLKKKGFTVAVATSSASNPRREDEFGNADAIVYPKVNMAVVEGEPNHVAALEFATSDASDPIFIVREEKVRHALVYTTEIDRPSNTDTSVYSAEFMRGYERAVDRFLSQLAVKEISLAAQATLDESKSTWGLQATRVLETPFTGRGIRIAVLDTGIDFTNDQYGTPKFHPDFEGRTITTASFVDGVSSAKDGAGHGTHCVGTACGPMQPDPLPRYGIAHEAEIFVGKVLNDLGSGADGWIIAGIEWAIASGCHVISMSFGSAAVPGEPFDPVYEELGQRALDAGTLLIAAAGNNSSRPDVIRPVNAPANCPSIMAVGAVDSDLNLASFTTRGVNPNGGQVDIAAPGVKVYSSLPLPTAHGRSSGTSMATPHVAGIAALHAEANPNARGKALWNLVTGSAKSLPFGTQDVGVGLVQAPTAANGSTSPVIVGAPKFAIQETSPIIVGGGGSVGLDFNDTHYRRNATNLFISPSDKLVSCHVIHQNGKLLRNFFPEIDGHQSAVIITCKNSTGGDVVIRVTGGPSGPLSISFDETALPFDQGRKLRYGAGLKVLSVRVENVLTGSGPPAFEVPADWAGIIKVDN